MKDKSATEKLLKEIDAKYKSINQDSDVHLKGLLHSNSITYWDYIHTDALLGLQIQRTNLPDEMVFIAYHQ
ncbi:MAG: tryptophan 2,3-dioxygenase, partial [Flavobacteriaceae bacterium]|nr:tryptophan 2,3-dioxygenase [Flavobacteriaceae bacterium]